MSHLIKIQNISKSYPSLNSARQRFKSLIAILINKKITNGTVVLSNINLQVKKGESLAIIGKNGAGKSTLLKVICGVIKATTGTVEVNGNIGALLELGSGFHPEYTGRENLQMSAALAGMNNKQINNNIQQMIDFADIGEYIDQPVKNYSSGMIVRLGFSVVTVTKPDLLITDEVLAVGDTDFQRKCIAWIDMYLKNGGTLLLVSHSIYHVQKLCKHAIWIEKGKIKKIGDSFLVSQEYQNHYDNSKEVSNNDNKVKSICYITSFKIFDNESNEIDSINTNEDIILKINIHTPYKKIPGLSFEIKKGEYPIYSTVSKIHKIKSKMISDDEYEFIIKLPNNQLLPAEYKFIIHAMDSECLNMLYKTEKKIKIISKTHEMGAVILDTKWN